MATNPPYGYPTTPGSNLAGGAQTQTTFGTVSYPSVSTLETQASQLQLDPRVVIAFAAINGFAPSTSSIGLAFQNSGLGIFNGWLSSSQLDSSVTLDLWYAYTNFNATQPGNPQALISWAQGAGFVNSQGKQYQTPPIGYGYPPQSATWTIPGSSTPSTSAASSSSSFFNINFGTFFSQILSNPMGAISSQPITAAIVGYALLKLKPWKMRL